MVNKNNNLLYLCILVFCLGVIIGYFLLKVDHVSVEEYLRCKDRVEYAKSHEVYVSTHDFAECFVIVSKAEGTKLEVIE